MTTRPIQRQGDNVVLAILLSLVALVLFQSMGLVIKHLSPRFSAAELSAWRNFFGLFPSGIALLSSRAWHQNGRTLKLRQWKLAFARGLSVSFAQLFFYVSLGTMAYATATTITYANALFMTALAIPILGEKVGPVRWFAVLIGFAGVVLVMNPTAETFQIATLAPLGSALLYALSGISSRLIDPEVPSPLINLYSVSISMITSLVIAALTGGFSPITTWSDAFWLLAMGTFGGTAVLVMVISFRMTEQSNLAPFTYFGIPVAFIFGWLFFGETPFNTLFPGGLLIMIGGLTVIWRERMKKKTSAATPPEA
ncbi:carboxylate/amino acid/amine transporter [Marinibacterium anthonyi]|nr:carboxylate/amino acid/amine transporter [Marinibacterium anthonyi]